VEGECDGTAQREGESSKSYGLLSNEETKLEKERKREEWALV